MKLQVEFYKTLEYRNKTYAEASSEVYQNRDYMLGLYLPRILISHYLWEHHYVQLKFYEKEQIPQIEDIDNLSIYDVGVSTGFYTKEYLRRVESSQVVGFDMSPHSLEHTEMMVKRRDFSEWNQSRLGDILERDQTELCNVINSIEVLEHQSSLSEFDPAKNFFINHWNS